MFEKKVWSARVEADPEDPEQCIINLPDELIAQLGWVEGELLNWVVQDNGTIILERIQQ